MDRGSTPMGIILMEPRTIWLKNGQVVYIVPPYPPWYPTWGVLTPNGGYIPTNEHRLEQQLKEIGGGCRSEIVLH